MHQIPCMVLSVRPLRENIFVLAFDGGPIGPDVRPGQFVNVRVAGGVEPLLRRPFSVYRVDGRTVEIIFNVVGRGTDLLSKKRPGEEIDVLGPLGVPFSVDAGDYVTAILVAGGLGVAPMPVLTQALAGRSLPVRTLVGGRSASFVVTDHLRQVSVATDDGSLGVHGTVVDLLLSVLDAEMPERPRIFGCGPTAMLRALSNLARDRSILCEVSLEGPMACGIGICQGCPVELTDGPRKYALVCKDGPTFDVRRINI